MKKFLTLILLLGIGIVPNVAFGNIKFKKDGADILANSFKEEFGDKAGVAVDTFKRVYDKDKGIDAEGMATVYASGVDSDKVDGFRFKQFWSRIVGKISEIFTDCIWVESDQVCVPVNPCENQGFEKYCNREFKGFGDSLIQKHQFLVDTYAKSHNLSCSFNRLDSDANGTKRALCAGDDVMFFEFDDAKQDNCFQKEAIKILCIVSKGKLLGNGESCRLDDCDDDTLKSIISQYNDSDECFKKSYNGKIYLDYFDTKKGGCTLRLSSKQWSEY